MNVTVHTRARAHTHICVKWNSMNRANSFWKLTPYIESNGVANPGQWRHCGLKVCWNINSFGAQTKSLFCLTDAEIIWFPITYGSLPGFLPCFQVFRRMRHHAGEWKYDLDDHLMATTKLHFEYSTPYRPAEENSPSEIPKFSLSIPLTNYEITGSSYWSAMN